MPDCSHCVDKTEHPGFVMLVEGAHWVHSSQPLQQSLHIQLIVGPFSPPERAVQFCTVMQRCSGTWAAALSLARKWKEIQGGTTTIAPQLYGDSNPDDEVLSDAQRLQLVREAVLAIQ